MNERDEPDPGVIRTPLLSPFARKSPYLTEASAAEMYSSNFMPTASASPSHTQLWTHLDSQVVIAALEPPATICV